MASSGNFCTLNPLAADDGTAQSKMATLSKGNLHTSRGTNDKYNQAIGTHGVATGKWYTEWYISDAGFPSWLVGWHYRSDIGEYSGASPVSDVANICSFGYFTGSNIYLTKFGSTSTATLQIAYSSWTNQGVPTTGDVIMNCMDFDAGKGWWGINGVWGDIGSGAGDPANGTNPSLTWTVADYDDFKFPFTLNWAQSSTAGEITFNAGQDSTFSGAIAAGSGTDDNSVGNFKYSVPAGFLALSSSNLPISSDIDPAQTDDDFPQKNFNVVTFTGNGSTNAVTGLGFKPDLIWGFTRDGNQDKRMIDSTRGGSSRLYSNNTNTADTSQTAISAFGTDGFTANGGYFNNDNTKACGAWCWRANGGTTSTNSDGSADTTVQANTAAGFSIFTFANSSGSKTLGHGLGKAPAMYVLRGVGEGTSWGVYHKSLGATKYLNFNSTNGSASSTAYFNDTEPTSSVLSVGSTLTGSSLICYAWAQIEGYSNFGTYIGNGNADGPFIYTGFRPRMLFFKRDTNGHNWITFDTATVTFNPVNEYANWDTGNASGQNASDKIDVLSNGFKLRSTGSSFNHSGSTFIYGAWGDVPFKYNNTF